MTLASAILDGNRLALARLLTLVENNTPEGLAELNELFPYTGKAHLVGVTGAPGTGKSSLVNQLALYYRHPPQDEEPRQVAVIAVDPSSPFTGGAILGDRIRMRDLAGDPGVFIRSMASRGTLGGLATATAGLVQVLDAAGYPLIFIETVGAGQAEVEVARLAHTTLVVEAPGLGDDIQAIKAGILEVADILVINKADRPGVENTERALRSMLQLAFPDAQKGWEGHHASATTDKVEAAPGMGWQPPIIRTIALDGSGIPELGRMIDQHRQFLRQSGTWVQRERYRFQSELEVIIRNELVSRWRSSLSNQRYQEMLERLVQRKISPSQAAQALLQESDS
jgi:LAO/AO transport system kinase